MWFSDSVSVVTAPWPYSAHRRACVWKQQELRDKISSLPSVYTTQLSNTDTRIHALSLSNLVQECKSGTTTPAQVLEAYGKAAIQAHNATNCLTDIMFDHALAPDGVGEDHRPLLGVPVTIKDTVDIVGHDTTLGYSANVGRPATSSAAIVRLLQDAGATIHAKTTVPTSLFSLETFSDVFGVTTNPYSDQHSSGASGGGGACVIPFRGAKIEIGTDVAGSVRIPAHFCGVWSLKGSAGRFPVGGTVSSMMGLEAVPIVCSPMAGSVQDLEDFWRIVVGMKPWTYDHTCVPLEWRSSDLHATERKLKWGVIWEDGIVPPTPACERSLTWVVEALKKQGHDVVDFTPPNIIEGMKAAYQLTFADGGAQVEAPLTGKESLNPALASIVSLVRMPTFIKKTMAFFARPFDPFYASFLEIMSPKTILEERALIVKRDEFRAAWHTRWDEEELDFVISVPHPLPALEHGGTEKATLMSSGYTFLWSFLDYSVGVLPVTFVDRCKDALPDNFKTSARYTGMNSIAKGAYTIYDPDKMHGLPLGVQIAGRRLEEEKVLEGMKMVEFALKEAGRQFVGRDFNAV